MGAIRRKKADVEEITVEPKPEEEEEIEEPKLNVASAVGLLVVVTVVSLSVTRSYFGLLKRSIARCVYCGISCGFDRRVNRDWWNQQGICWLDVSVLDQLRGDEF